MSARDDVREAAEVLRPESAVAQVCRLLLAAWDTPATDDTRTTDDATDEWLTADQVAARINHTRRYVYDHADKLGVRRESRRSVRFSARAVEKYMSKRKT